MDELETKWPKRLGVISLIYAIGGLLVQALGAAWAVAGEWLLGLGNFEIEIPVLVKLVQGGMVVVASILGFVMLVGAINLLRRRRSGVSLLKAWAVLRMVLVLVGLVAAILIMPARVDMQRSIAEQTNEKRREAGLTTGMQETDDEKIRAKIIRSSVIMSGVVAAYPLFLGFWLSRRKVGDEVSQWA